MSVMSELFIEVQLDLEQGLDPRAIARRLDIPVSWVFSVAETLGEDDEYEEIYDPRSEFEPQG